MTRWLLIAGWSWLGIACSIFAGSALAEEISARRRKRARSARIALGSEVEELPRRPAPEVWRCSCPECLDQAAEGAE